jgi:hypothetical protein
MGRERMTFRPFLTVSGDPVVTSLGVNVGFACGCRAWFRSPEIVTRMERCEVHEFADADQRAGASADILAAAMRQALIAWRLS